VSAEVIIPWRGGCAHRERALARVLELHELPTTLAVQSLNGPWVKALAVMPAIARSTADLVVVADADVWCDGIPEALRALERGAAWAIPHQLVHRLEEHGQPAEVYVGIEGGGIVAAPRRTLLDIPLDPRFVGWGQEDESWGAALSSVAGAPWRGTADLIHYWHPPQQRISRTRGSRQGWNLRRRYLRARANPEDMRTLIAEAHAALDAHQHTVHDRPPLGVG
jgi:hypothetical protein